MKARKTIIKEKYTKTLLSFSSSPKTIWLPKVSVILKSTINSHETKFVGKFILDTGASISIINSKYSDFIKHLDQKDHLVVQYGAGNSKKLPIYQVVFIIRGREIKSTVAYDSELPYLLLGHYDFFENFSYNLFDSLLKESRLY